MKINLATVVKVLIFFAVGVLLFWLAYRGQDFGQIFEAVRLTNWFWIAFSVLVSLLGHYSRAVRWGLLLEPFGYQPRKVNLFVSVMIMYLSNMAIPRSGEVVRCGIISRYEKIPFARCLGTVVTERIADMVVLLILTVIVLTTQVGIVGDILDNNPDVEARINMLEGYIPHLVVGGIVLGALAVYVVRLFIKKNIFGIGEKIKSVLSNFKDGMLTILSLKKRWQFLLHSLFINFVYFITIYLGFKAFPFTEHLSLMVALIVFVLGTFGVVVPSPGGMGTWHFIAIELLSLFGVRKDPDGGAFALVIHGIQDIVFIVVGFASMVLMPFINSSYQPLTPDEAEQEH